jgi:beta-lactamase superfamily II metal-dependent hydrolase
MGIRFKFIKAFNGDSILISTNNSNILIDGGTTKTYYKSLKKEIDNLKDADKKLDLVVLTHYDDDHIGGILKLLDDEKKSIKQGGTTILKEFWFNSFDEALVNISNTSNETSAKQQIKFDEYIKELLPFINYSSRLSTDNITEKFLGENQEIRFILLSPNNQKLDKLFTKYKREIKNYQTSALSNDYDISIEELSQRAFKKDTSLPNGASIAFIMEYKELKFMFLGDAHIDLIIDRLKELGYSSKNRLKLEFVKLSHHGSSKNLNSEFLDLIDTNKFVILTNGSKYNHPNKEALSRIILNPNRDKNIRIYFICNYKNIIKNNPFSYDEEEKYNFELICKNELQVGSKNEK